MNKLKKKAYGLINICLLFRIKIKIDKIKEKLELNECELAILIDDTHEILFLALSELKEKVIPFHVITLID